MVPGEQADIDERRLHVRKPALWKAEIRAGLEHFPCRVFDMSLGGAGLRTDAHLLLGTKIKLVIDHIGVIKAKVVWVAGDKMGIEFTVDESEVRFILGSRGKRLGLEEEPVQAQAQAPVAAKTEDAPPAEIARERREYSRKSTLWKARLRVAGEYFPCRIIDMSFGGASVRTETDLELGIKLRLEIEHIAILKGRVAWSDGDAVGIEFIPDESEVRYLLGPRGRHLEQD